MKLWYCLNFAVLLFYQGVYGQQQWSSPVTFDSSSDSLAEFLTYPDSLWQIGAPNKHAFDSAYSAPFVLITDTVNPYSTNVDTSYAELVIPYLRDMTGWLPEGANVAVSFRYRSDMNPTEARGWIELYQDSLTIPHATSFGWKRLEDFEWFTGGVFPYQCGLDAAGNFTGVQPWSYCWFELGCAGQLTNNTESFSIDTLRVRFAFARSANAAGRGGWRIDELEVLSSRCMPGSVAEQNVLDSKSFPNPADYEFRIDVDVQQGRKLDILVRDGLGRTVLRKTTTYANSIVLDLSRLGSGNYSYQVIADSGMATGKFIVAR